METMELSGGRVTGKRKKDFFIHSCHYTKKLKLKTETVTEWHERKLKRF